MSHLAVTIKMMGLKFLAAACLIIAVNSHHLPLGGGGLRSVGNLGGGGGLKTVGNLGGGPGAEVAQAVEGAADVPLRAAAGIINTATGGVGGGIGSQAANTVEGIARVPLGIAGGAIDTVLGTAGGLVGQVGAGVGINLFGIFKPFIQGLTNLSGNARSFLGNLKNLNAKGSFDDALSAIVTVAAAAGGIINAVLPGTGSLLAQLIIGVLKAFFCVSGSAGASLCGNGNTPKICSSGFGAKFNIPSYDGSLDNVNGVFNFYDLQGIEGKFEAALNQATNGQGINALQGSQKIIVQWILELSGYLKSHANGNLSTDDVRYMITLLIEIIGGIGNSYDGKIGNNFAEQLVKYFSVSTNGSLNLAGQLSTIKKSISKCGTNSFGGAISIQTGNRNNNGQTTTTQNNNNNGQTTNQNNQNQNNDNQNGQTTTQNNDQNVQTTTQNNQNDQTQNNNDQNGQTTTTTQNNDQNGQTTTQNNNQQQQVATNGQSGLNLFAIIKPLIKGLTKLSGNAASLLTDLNNLNVAGSLDDALNAVVTVAAAAGGVINAVIPGTASLLAQLNIGVLKIFFCVTGSAGINIRANGQTLNVCNSGYSTKWNVPSYSGSLNNVNDISNHFGLTDIESKFEAAINKATNGKGVNALQGSQKIIAQWILQLSSYVKSHANSKLSKDDVRTMLTLLIEIIGGIGNSYDSNIGVNFAEQLVKYFSVSTKGSLNLQSQLPTIKNNIRKCGKNSLGGALIIQVGSGNQQNNGETQNNDQNGQTTTTTQNNQHQNNDNQNGQTTTQNNDQNVQTTTQNNQNDQTQNNNDHSGQTTTTTQNNDQNGETTTQNNQNVQTDTQNNQDDQTQNNNDQNGQTTTTTTTNNDQNGQTTTQDNQNNDQNNQNDQTQNNNDQNGQTTTQDNQNGQNTTQNNDQNGETTTTTQNNDQNDQTTTQDNQNGQTTTQDNQNDQTNTQNNQNDQTQNNDVNGQTTTTTQNNDQNGQTTTTTQNNDQNGQTTTQDNQNDQTDTQNNQNDQTQNNNDQSGQTTTTTTTQNNDQNEQTDTQNNQNEQTNTQNNQNDRTQTNNDQNVQTTTTTQNNDQNNQNGQTTTQNGQTTTQNNNQQVATNGQSGLNLFAIIKPLINGLTKLTGNAASLLTDLKNLNVAGSLDDALNAVVTVAAAAGGVINAVIPGTGSLLAQLIIGVLKIFFCVSGSAGINIRGNGKNLNVCNSGYANKWNVPSYSGSLNNVNDISNHFGLTDIESKFQAAINKATNGKGVDALQGSQKIIAQWILQLSSFVKSHANNNLSTDDVRTMLTLLIEIIGGIGNSYDSSVGVNFAEQLVKYFSVSTKGFLNLQSQLPTIKNNIRKCGKNSLGGAIIIQVNNRNQQQNGQEQTGTGNDSSNGGNTSRTVYHVTYTTQN